ncbi:Multidrug resistance-associated protein [Paratrimastix pyriformis]|uniref:Multidrug resistance-associated protein n=1 Tax=Paratrimastix pyriformis TaxID=342808 RepID=A0ABQ8UCF3_9EUKA|nr:Multidrug resistance-associated protein [Paratrimastix pyriformis]
MTSQAGSRAEKPSKGQKPTKNFEDQAGIFSQVFFVYFFRIICRGLRRPLENDDLWEVYSADRADIVHEKLKRIWQPKFLRYQQDLASFETAKRAFDAQVASLPDGAPRPPAPVPPKKPSFIATLIKLGGWRIYVSGVLSLLLTVTQFIGPLTLTPLIEAIFALRSGSSQPFPYHWAVLYVLAPFLGALAQAHSDRLMFHVASQMRSAMMTGVYEKVLHLNNASSSQTDSGQMITLISADARQATEYLQFMHAAWTSPLHLIGAMVLIFRTILWAGGPPLGLMILVMPIQGLASAILLST